MIRRYSFCSEAEVTLLTERRRCPPYGLCGGNPGLVGMNRLYDADGNCTELQAKQSLLVQENQVIEIATPGGGGWGALLCCEATIDG